MLTCYNPGISLHEEATSLQELTLDEIHAEELAILKKVDAICCKIGAKYWLMFGTLLGAVRHKGFIPWDDDIDIGMMRGDYDKLTDCLSSGAAEENGLHLDTVRTRDNYVYYIARVSETKNVITSGESYKSGVFIDIYPMDSVTEKWLDSWQRSYMLNMILNGHIMRSFSSTIKSFRGLDWRKRLIDSVCAFFTKAACRLASFFGNKSMWLTYYWIVERITGMCISDKGEYVCVTRWEPRSTWRKACFAETLTAKFEDFDAPIPAGYDEVLRERYGDYMTPPPEDQQKPHKIYTVCRP